LNNILATTAGWNDNTVNSIPATTAGWNELTVEQHPRNNRRLE
jgi:hypothetical protein